MQITTAEEIRRSSRLGESVIAGHSLERLLWRRDWWEEGFVQLRLPAARVLARMANANRRDAVAAGPVIVGTIMETPAKPKAVRAPRRAHALPAAR